MKTDDKKRGCGPGNLGHCIVSVPRSTGPQGPLAPFYTGWFWQYGSSRFSSRENRQSRPGVQGALSPDASFPPFFAERKGCRGMSAYRKNGFMVCPRKKNAILAKKLSNAATSFFPRRKRKQNSPLGGYPQTPGDPVGSLLRRTSPPLSKTNDTIRGCGPGFLGRRMLFSVPRPTGPLPHPFEGFRGSRGQ